MSSIIGTPGPSAPAPQPLPPPQLSGSNKIPILFGAVVALVLAVIYLFYQVNSIKGDVQAQLTDARDQIMAEIAKEHETSTVSNQSTKKRTDDIQKELDDTRRQASQLSGQARIDADKHADELAAKLQEAQDAQAKQVATLNTDVSTVKDAEANTQKNVGAVQTQVGQVNDQVSVLKTQQTATQQQLEKTVADLKSTVGDLGVQSGLIATNSKELDALKKLGERNYYDFKVAKSKAAEKVGDVQIRLTAADPKKNKYTVVLIADDKTVEKKDKSINEPVQFYMSRASQPYELVVNQISKDLIVGYVSAPKVQQSRKQ